MSPFWSDLWENHVRGRESPALLLRINVERIDSEAADPGYIRIKADGHFLFSHRLLLRDGPDPAELLPGQELFVGAHRLDDGCFWMHWARTKSGLELTTSTQSTLNIRV